MSRPAKHRRPTALRFREVRRGGFVLVVPLRRPTIVAGRRIPPATGPERSVTPTYRRRPVVARPLATRPRPPPAAGGRPVAPPRPPPAVGCRPSGLAFAARRVPTYPFGRLGPAVAASRLAD